MLVVGRLQLDETKERSDAYSEVVLDVTEPCRVVVTLVRVCGAGKARIGVAAPESTRIWRRELEGDCGRDDARKGGLNR